jgi:hypothetical protein
VRDKKQTSYMYNVNIQWLHLYLRETSPECLPKDLQSCFRRHFVHCKRLQGYDLSIKQARFAYRKPTHIGARRHVRTNLVASHLLHVCYRLNRRITRRIYAILEGKTNIAHFGTGNDVTALPFLHFIGLNKLGALWLFFRFAP